MKTIYTVFYAFKTDKNLELCMNFEKEEDAKKFRDEASKSPIIYHVYVMELTVYDEYKNWMKEHVKE